MLSQAPPSAEEAESSPGEIMVPVSLLKALLFQCHAARFVADAAIQQITQLLESEDGEAKAHSPKGR